LRASSDFNEELETMVDDDGVTGIEIVKLINDTMKGTNFVDFEIQRLYLQQLDKVRDEMRTILEAGGVVSESTRGYELSLLSRSTSPELDKFFLFRGTLFKTLANFIDFDKDDKQIETIRNIAFVYPFSRVVDFSKSLWDIKKTIEAEFLNSPDDFDSITANAVIFKNRIVSDPAAISPDVLQYRLTVADELLEAEKISDINIFRSVLRDWYSEELNKRINDVIERELDLNINVLSFEQLALKFYRRFPWIFKLDSTSNYIFNARAIIKSNYDSSQLIFSVTDLFRYWISWNDFLDPCEILIFDALAKIPETEETGELAKTIFAKTVKDAIERFIAQGQTVPIPRDLTTATLLKSERIFRFKQTSEFHKLNIDLLRQINSNDQQITGLLWDKFGDVKAQTVIQAEVVRNNQRTEKLIHLLKRCFKIDSSIQKMIAEEVKIAIGEAYSEDEIENFRFLADKPDVTDKILKQVTDSIIIVNDVLTRPVFGLEYCKFETNFANSIFFDEFDLFPTQFLSWDYLISSYNLVARKPIMIDIFKNDFRND
jgi:hypothetical protein